MRSELALKSAEVLTPKSQIVGQVESARPVLRQRFLDAEVPSNGLFIELSC